MSLAPRNEIGCNQKVPRSHRLLCGLTVAVPRKEVARGHALAVGVVMAPVAQKDAMDARHTTTGYTSPPPGERLPSNLRGAVTQHKTLSL